MIFTVNHARLKEIYDNIDRGWKKDGIPAGKLPQVWCDTGDCCVLPIYLWPWQKKHCRKPVKETPWTLRKWLLRADLWHSEKLSSALESKDCWRDDRCGPEVTHMIVFDVLSRESPVGDKGHRMRLFLTEADIKRRWRVRTGLLFGFWTMQKCRKGICSMTGKTEIYEVKIYMAGKNADKQGCFTKNNWN